ncbi:2-succinyl-5-enolpyruvyl-6-hydroxy-3-cyclohexene-1-carboxylic-acid synthase [Leuconostoc fallax]|uniref:2-succinyl-5-enolpyruvyl-6-hydroxy-3- cyclohexene-1-carboxylic-acid synthase n=1 Tax=Leuconostoc fallax TaxID=1251 RepID=UPI0020901185|nr:2-succinyl-5-enolpyruvyl-6-hydroxy-3-cyclohexene-1-carboxylic-acid synthase [Leuconostoc fallax]MCO6183698.1 2-succinyl-5-enolpyruvyl-6-hydroxy-3-cyclohexene-1-carboxylic-acid synthase [Leuconostoc fallax]
MTDALTINTKYLLTALMRSGVRHFVVSPGSRNTPIALLLAQLAESEKIALFVDVDERSAAFFALGIAKVTLKPVVVLGTSGTAITEFTSAVAEASVSHIPLIVLSADRPQELQNNGAPQTISQTHLFSHFVKQDLELTLQDNHPDVPEYIAYEVQKLIYQAQIAPRGPIHINLPLRKPLMPDMSDNTPLRVKQLTRTTAPNIVPQKTLEALQNKKILLLCGPNESEDYSELLRSFSEKYHIPVIADVLSRVRYTHTITGIDQFIKADILTDDALPDIVIRFGATPVAGQLLGWLKKHEITTWYVGEDAGNDHSRHASHIVPIAVTNFLEQLTQIQNNSTAQSEFYTVWQTMNQKYQNQLIHNVGELSLIDAIDHFTHDAQSIFVSNSMPIRDMDNFFLGRHTHNIYANRGANGIDGVVSSAMGMAATSQEQRSLLLIGDIALFHDMNGLMMGKQYQLPLDIIVTNNNGGSIFSFLPQAQQQEYFDTLFGTPLGLDLSRIAMLYDLTYEKISTTQGLGDILRQSVVGTRIIEYSSNRQDNYEQHQDFTQMLREHFNE